jgi:hypothetical protein
MPKAVNIIGKGKTWVDAPREGEAWGITQLYLRRPVSLVIDMNRYDDGRWGPQEKAEADKVLAMCALNGVPYIGLHNYPIDEVMARYETDYFSSTVDYAIALALFRGYDELHLYGITMSIADYSKLKCGCDFWCGYAKGLGAKVIVHGETTVMKTTDGKVYGYDYPQGGIYAESGSKFQT